MRKKSLAFCFMMLANLIILAHAAIPHHHHDNHICLSGLNEIHSAQTIQHHADDTHDGQLPDHCCVLKQVILYPAQSHKAELKCPTDNQDLTDIGISHFGVINENSNSHNPDLLAQQFPKEPKFLKQILFIGFSRSLRAPPLS
ncbi:MAG: hypothetical protein Q7J34_11565 [Bacteroidales bacterium]|nr:hypothetical protein [Bacteroidales bacterium]